VPGESSVTSATLDYFDLRLRATFLAALEARFTRRFLTTGEDFIIRTVIPEYKSEVVQPSRKKWWQRNISWFKKFIKDSGCDAQERLGLGRL
jgi:hypothetical protein